MATVRSHEIQQGRKPSNNNPLRTDPAQRFLVISRERNGQQNTDNIDKSATE
jgi:hypothetical protein